MKNRLFKQGFSVSRRGLAAVMCVVLLITTFAGLHVFQVSAGDVEYYSYINNYYPLKGGYTNSEFYKNSDWSFEGRNFMESPDFKTSSEDFAAPEASVASDGRSAGLVWQTVDSAAQYSVDVFVGIERAETLCKTVSETEATLEELTPGVRYAVQITALDAQGGLLKASSVREIVPYDAAADQYVMLDGTSADGLSGFSIANYPDASDSALAFSCNSSDAWTNKGLGTYQLPDRVEAIAFWYGQTNNDGSTDNWMFPNFRLNWSYTDGNGGSVSAATAGSNVTIYFFADDGEVYTNLRGGDDYNLWHFSSPTAFKQGLIVIPVAIYKDGASLAGKKVTFDLGLDNMREYQQSSPDGEITQVGSGFGDRTYYLDNFCTISDLNLYLSSLEDVSYSASDNPIYVCDNADPTRQTLTNSDFGSVYSYIHTGDPGISYNLKDTGNGLYGLSLRFTSPESAYYDVSNYLKVINNSIEAAVYYRLMKEDAAGAETQVWPQNDEWYQMDANSSNFNPSSPLELVNVYLAQGEKLRFEAYADVMSESGGEVNVKLVNTFLVPVETVETSKGTVTTYPAVDYMDCFHTTGSFTADRYVAGASRWTFSAMSLEDYSAIPFNNYNEGWGRMTYRDISGIVGVYTDIYDTSVTLKTQTNSTAGVRMDFTSTQNGRAVISMQNEPTGGSPAGNLRILRNDEQIYPVGSGWVQDPGQFSVSCDVQEGDVISIQQYCTGGMTMDGVPTVKVYTGNIANLAGSTYYSALRERPFNGKTYNAAWDQSDNIWNFNLYDSGMKVGNRFSSDEDGLVYSSELGTADGYRFTDKEILFDISQAGRGLSMDFTVPLTGTYDVGYALKLFEGSGKISYRILNDDTQLYPASGWSSVDADNPGSECHELELNAGTVLTLQAYAEQSSGPITLSIGDPTIVYNSESLLNENGKCFTYNAFTFLNQEQGYTGPITLDNRRFVYEIDTGSAVLPVTYSDVATGKFTLSQTSSAGYELTESGLSMLLPDNAAGKVTLTLPRQGYGNILAYATSADGGAFTVSILKNGEELYSETTAVHEIDTYAALEAGDTVVITASGSSEIRWSTLSVSVDGVYDNENDPSASIFTASLVLPYGEDDYTGSYKASDKIWNFKTYYAETDKVKWVDFYDSEDDRHLYEKDSGVGYYFDNKLLFGDLKEIDAAPVGLSLEFNTPADNTYEMFTGLQLVSPADAFADIFARITVNGETVWPADGDWNKTASVVSGQDIAVPTQYLELTQGDRVVLQIYAENISASDQTVKIALAAPRVKVYDVTMGNADFSAFVYNPGTERPYIGMDYIGEYYHTEGMWNFEFLDFFPGGEKTDTPTVVTGDSFSVNTITSNLGAVGANYQIGDTQTTIVSYAAVDGSANRVQTTGQSMRFVSPIEGTVQLIGTPVVSSLVSGQKAYFRILHNGETVWPAGGGWEELDSDNAKSAFVRMDLDIAVGDEICYQFYTDAADQAIAGMSDRRAAATFKLSPAVVYYDYISTAKSSFNYLSDIITGFQISPYWELEYSMDRENPQWTQLEKSHSEWNMWLDSTESMGWATNYGIAWIHNGFGKTIQPIVSATYNANVTGYLTVNKMSLNFANSIPRFPANVRITKNGEKIWPTAEDWAYIDLENTPSIENFRFAVTEGDKIRFEVSPAEPMEASAEDVRIDINPQFTYSQYAEVYSKDNDIFGMLDEETYAYFKAMTAGQFDTDPAGTMQQSSDFLAALALRSRNWFEKVFGTAQDSGSSGSSNSSGGSSETVIVTPGTEDQFIPGTEDQVVKTRTPRVVTIVTGGIPIWLLVLIIVGSVLVVGTAAFIVVFLYKKKRKAIGEKQ